MSFRLWTVVSLLLLIVLAPEASAGEIAGVSHRARLYDSASHGNNVYVVGYPGLVLRSTDKGKTFAPLTVPTRDALFSVDINTAGLGAIVGRGGLVLLTSDGGTTWTKTNALAAGAEGEDKPHLFAVDVLENGVILAVGDFATIVRSSDKGKSWQKQSFDPAAPAAEEGSDGSEAAENDNEGFEDEARLTGISFGDDQHGWAVGEFGFVLASDDGGSTWKRQRSATSTLLFSVHATSATHVVVAGSEGTIMESHDGRSWKIVKTPTTNHLFGVWASADACMAVGADGTLIRRVGAAPFELVPTNVHTWLSSVALHDATHGVVAGGLGYLLRTDNAGKTFTIVTGE